MDFSSFVITQSGQKLMAKIMQGTECEFTAIKLSAHEYGADDLVPLTDLQDVKQIAPITRKVITSENAIQIEGAVDNLQLTEGYYIHTIGIYAVDPDEGEILYAAAAAVVAGYMPPYNGITVSGGYFKFAITVGNAENVTVVIDPAGFATIGEVRDLEARVNQNEIDISDLKGYVGMVNEDIYGVEADFENRVFTRIGGSVGKSAGADFNSIPMFGGRYRCNLTDAGVEVAKYGDAGYTETGKLTTSVTVGGTTYQAGTIVQVMVKQPRFYYRVVPLKADKIQNGEGYHLRKARYYVSATPKKGFKLHPAFMINGIEQEYIYISAYEGSLFDMSASAYMMNDEQVADFSADKLCSIANAKPISGLTQNLTRRNSGKLAENRGSGWRQAFAATASLTQMLFMIEYASFNTQSSIGDGAVHKTDDGSTNMAEKTGGTSGLGNASGAVTNSNGIQIVTYRGEENFWGNIWKWIDGINVYANAGKNNSVYIADHAFEESKKGDHYQDAGFVTPSENGYVNAFGYSENFDWLFMPSETNHNANTAVPVGDYYWNNTGSDGWMVAILGAGWDDGLYAGGFYWTVSNAPSNRRRFIGGRLAYVPKLSI